MNIVILAAGSGKRMQSDLPKVLHRLAGKPLITHVIDTARKIKPSKIIIVIGKGGKHVRHATFADDLEFVEQIGQLGTGHAVQQTLSALNDALPTLILYGDVPLISAQTLTRLVSIATNKFGILTARLASPTGYGRIIRNTSNQVLKIVEEKDATESEKLIDEINTGIMIVSTVDLKRWLNKLDNNNAQQEFLLTDIVCQAAAEHIEIATTCIEDASEIAGVNSRKQLAELERQFRLRYANDLLERGVGIADPNRLDIRGELSCGRDVFIDINAIFNGNVTLGNGVHIGAQCILTDCQIGDNTVIEPFSHITSATIGADAFIGPYARIRPGTELADKVRIGNFVELKNVKFGNSSKANHLAYVGDAQIGDNVNLGAGTITCNYDGVNKHQTLIGNNVFVGSDCQLIAPLSIADNTQIAAGTTVWRSIDDGLGMLIFNEKKQLSREVKKQNVKPTHKKNSKN